jgi:hypothetical protein
VATHHCPSCQLIFSWRTELDWHLREDHPDRHFEYPRDESANVDWPMEREPQRHTAKPVSQPRVTGWHRP